MPASQFFAMRRAALVLHARDRMELCDISSLPMFNYERYSELRECYSNIVREPKIETENTPAPALDGDAAKYFMMSLFASKKGM